MHGSAANPQFDIVDTAKSEASFKTFLMALQSCAHMVDYLKGSGPFTVFMPTDQAFAALEPGTIERLEMPGSHDDLEKFLKYHIVRGIHSSSDVRTMLTLQTVSGDKVAVHSDAAALKINNATVIGREIFCTNGIIHVLDSVLLGFA